MSGAIFTHSLSSPIRTGLENILAKKKSSTTSSVSHISTRHIRFNTAVEEARWDDETNTWKTKIVRLDAKDSEFGKEYTITSDFLVSAVGQLNVPKYPDIQGLDSFKGKSMHSARWDWDYDVRDKNIGIIGNGASAAQIIPEVAKVCKSLTVFQRTPSWVIPRDDRPISATKRAMFNYVPFF
jgi:cation diffusion facilitator CzcD-associated flavoprotein CzcO